VVTDSIKSYQDKVTRVVIRNSFLTAYHGEVAVTNYTFKNKSDNSYTLYLEHPRIPEGRQRADNQWKLVESPELVETTESYWRFRVDLLPNKETTFTVKQEIVLGQQQRLFDLNWQTLQLWNKQKYFDKATATALKDVAECVKQQAAVNEEKARLENEQSGLYEAQKRIRENLNSLGDRPSEKELRERFVRTLQTQEDRLEEIDKKIKELWATRARLQETLQQKLAALEYDAPVGD